MVCMSVFYINFDFEISLDLHKSYKDSTESFSVPFLMLTTYITLVQ